MPLSKDDDAFNLESELQISEGKGGLPVIKVDNKYATAVISIYGAQVLSFKKKSSDSEEGELLFLSDKAFYEAGKAIKGGIPICWPWFGQDPEKRGRQAHGFARNVMWKLVSTSSNKDSGTQVVLSLNETEASKKLWPHSFDLRLTIDIGETLKLSLKTSNTGTQAFTITQALHTYFAVADITKVRIAGLDKTNYIDAVVDKKDKNDTTKTATALEDMPVLEQAGDVEFNQEVDRVYTLSCSKQCPALTLFDGEDRQVKIESKNSKTTVVWNPWVEISANSADLSNDACKHFVCIETANAADDVIEVLPNESFTLALRVI